MNRQQAETIVAASLQPIFDGLNPKPSRWISVADDLPDEDQVVLVAISEGDEPVWLGYHSDGVWMCVDAMEMPAEVYAWMPLPEAPGK